MNRILRRKAVMEATGLSYSTIHRKEKAGEFPSRIPLGPNAVGWYEHEVEKWIESRGRGGVGAPTAACEALRAGKWSQ